MKFFVDTNVFIYALKSHPEFGLKSKEILERADEGDSYTSTLVLKEICWNLEADDKIAEVYEVLNKIMNSNIDILLITPKQILKAAELKQKHKRIELNDLINYSVMKDSNIKVIFTNDDHFDKLSGVERKF